MRLAAAIVAIFLSSAASARTSTAPAAFSLALEKTFEVRVPLPFLEPGLGGAAAKAGDEVLIGPPSWSSATAGRMAASVWRIRTVASLTASADRKTILDAKTSITPGQMDAWRDRHGYLLRGGHYEWDSLDYERERSPLDAVLGRRLDQAIAGAMTLWIRRGAQSTLSAREELTGDDPAAILDKSFDLEYDQSGLVGNARGDFFIRLWGIPVRVRFELEPHVPDHDDVKMFRLARPLEFSYGDGRSAALSEWRRRHGYARTADGYAWDADFPAPPDAASTGPALDDLLDRSASFWAQVATEQVMSFLDQKLKDEIHWPGLPADQREETSTNRMGLGSGAMRATRSFDGSGVSLDNRER